MPLDEPEPLTPDEPVDDPNVPLDAPMEPLLDVEPSPVVPSALASSPPPPATVQSPSSAGQPVSKSGIRIATIDFVRVAIRAL
jgi:hypothetical protein